jgi:hypothetical protein
VAAMMTISSNSSIDSIVRSAERKALTVIKTSLGSVQSGRAVTITYKDVSVVSGNAWQVQMHLINKLAITYICMNKGLCLKLWLMMFCKVTSLLFEHGVIVGGCNKLVITDALGISMDCISHRMSK